jgi:phosphoribosylformimino-5-aminoimidazole carboxamide ribonucleotide (ProFAR) isomerase
MEKTTKEYLRDWKQKNKDKVNKYNNEYRQDRRVFLSLWLRKDKECRKAWRQYREVKKWERLQEAAKKNVGHSRMAD